jgi:hypothetical protein
VAFFYNRKPVLFFSSEKETRANSELAHVRADKQRLEALRQVPPPPPLSSAVSTSQEPIPTSEPPSRFMHEALGRDACHRTPTTS